MTPFSSGDSKPSVKNVNLYCSCGLSYVLEHTKLECLLMNKADVTFATDGIIVAALAKI